MRIGIGYDIHRLEKGRKLILGGVEIPHDKGLLGHSDGDGLLHAIADAMLGALALGDIGQHFPDTDPKYKGANSADLLKHVAKLVREKGWRVENVDANVIAEAPKLKPHIVKMRASIAEILGVSGDSVSVKARTHEKCDAVGKGEAMSMQAVVLLARSGHADVLDEPEETTVASHEPLCVYNTLTGNKEEFESIIPGKVGMYVCGITAYDSCHMGHARAALAFDVVFRYLKHRGYEVTFVRNYTDVDDKIINKARETGESCQAISERYIQEYKEDMGALNVQSPKVEPKATEHIADMIKTIEKLIARKHAYIAEDGSVYFAVRTFNGYGKLSGKKIEDLESGARVEVDEKKKDPLDFALWKASKPGEPEWDSPWGKGRPGWHIECSAMSSKYLGQPFDIHGGGRDLVFPHHENEVAQAEGAEDVQFVRYWLHNGFININAEKMSKSLGNITTIREMLKVFDAEVLRFFLIASHYRSPIDYTQKAMEESKAQLDRFYETAARVQKIHPGKGGGAPDAESEEEKEIRRKLATFEARFEEAMSDDFNTAGAIGVVFDVVRSVNRYLDAIGGTHSSFSGWVMLKFTRMQHTLDEVLGVFGSDPTDYLNRMKEKGAAGAGVDAAKVEGLIKARKAARAARDFGRADEIRDELGALGVELKDNPDGTTTWKMK